MLQILQEKKETYLTQSTVEPRFTGLQSTKQNRITG